MRHLYVLLLCFWVIPMFAQDYTYITDRRFKEPHDLIDYQFRPDRWEMPSEGDKGSISVGEFAFGIDGNNLFVKGDGIEGQYNINGIDEAEYGYVVKLINARNPGQQGHLKVILDKYRHAEALVFKQKTRGEETIYFLPEKAEQLHKKHDAYFTDRWETVVENVDSIWGLVVFPYIHYGATQEILNTKDTTSIRLIEEITIIDKTKKKRKKKRKKKKDDDEGEDEGEEEEPVKKKTKIIKKYFIDVQMMLRDKNGALINETTRYKVEGLREYQAEEAGPDDEHYQILLSIDKKNGIEEISIFLTKDRTVSSVEVGEDYFMMLGN